MKPENVIKLSPVFRIQIFEDQEPEITFAYFSEGGKYMMFKYGEYSYEQLDSVQYLYLFDSVDDFMDSIEKNLMHVFSICSRNNKKFYEFKTLETAHSDEIVIIDKRPNEYDYHVYIKLYDKNLFYNHRQLGNFVFRLFSRKTIVVDLNGSIV